MITSKESKQKDRKNIVAGILLFSMFLLFSVLNPNQVKSYASVQQKDYNPQDANVINVKLVNVNSDDMKFSPNSNILVLINAKSQLMVDGEFAAIDDVSKRISASFKSRISNSNDFIINN